MKRDFIHNAFSSWCLWFDHELLTKGEAYTNVSSPLYKINDVNLSGYPIYASPYKQWVYDTSIPGAQIPSGLYVNGSFVPRGSSGLRLDYQNGRGIFNQGAMSALVSGNYAVKDFNIYTTTKSDQEILFETSYAVNPSMRQVATGILSDKVVAPCIFLKTRGIDNTPRAFGGQYTTTVNIRAIALTDNEYDLNGLGNIFADAKEKHFLTMSRTPLNRYNDVKDGSYNYNQWITEDFTTENLGYIKNVSYSTLNASAIEDDFPDLYIGFIDFRLEFERFPHL